MKLIQLTQGYFTKVDDGDFEKLIKYKWHVSPGGRLKKYPRAVRGNHSGNYFHMSRQIMNCPKSMVVDHINRDTLDNRKCNLRIVNRSQNLINSGYRKNLSGFKGVTWHNQNKKWQAKIIVKGKQIYFGLYDDKIKAAKSYDKNVTKLFGKYCVTNKSLGLLI